MMAKNRALHGRSFWIVTFAFLTSMAFATAPTPLYAIYQQRSGFSAFTITLIFATYALGVLSTLITIGHLSDRVGRRRLLLPSVGLILISAAIFIFFPDLPGLLTARLVSGMGVGMLTATATAYLTELHTIARPGSGLKRAEITATAANIGGLGLGPLISGLLAQFAPAPLQLTYLVFAFLLLLSLVLLLRTPETVSVNGKWEYRLQRISVPREHRGSFAAAAMMAFVSFGMFGLFSSLAPVLIRGTLGISSLAVAGGVTFVVFASAAVMQIFSSRWALTTQIRSGLFTLGLGLLLVTGGILFASMPLLLLGGVIAGSGSGIAFKAGLGTAIGISSPEQRGEVIAGIFLAGYLGMSLPVLMLGALMLVIPLVPAVLGFGALLLLLLALTALLSVRASR